MEAWKTAQSSVNRIQSSKLEIFVIKTIIIDMFCCVCYLGAGSGTENILIININLIKVSETDHTRIN